MFEFTKFLIKENFYSLSLNDINDFFRRNESIYNEFNKLWGAVSPFCKYNNKQKIISMIAAHPFTNSIEDIRIHINTFFLNRDGIVSPSVVGLLFKINPNLKDVIISYTKEFPEKFTFIGRCELIRKNILNFPKCPVCGKNASWANASDTNTYCSAKCCLSDENLRLIQRKTMKELYGEYNYTQTEQFQIKRRATNKTKYGDESFINTKKYKETCLERYGVDNTRKIKSVTEKAERTCMERYGVRNATQSPEIFKKIQKSLTTIKQYKSTKIYYQGTYEYYFLEQMELIGLINEISIPGTVEYTFDGGMHIYHPDFQFRKKIIEIKSTWTYNRNGKDKKMGEKNNSKWDAVRAQGKEMIVLMSKKEIKNYVDNLL